MPEIAVALVINDGFSTLFSRRRGELNPGEQSVFAPCQAKPFRYSNAILSVDQGV
jgi:hypothetical protein